MQFLWNLICAVLWALFGMVLYALLPRRIRKIISRMVYRVIKLVRDACNDACADHDEERNRLKSNPKAPLVEPKNDSKIRVVS